MSEATHPNTPLAISAIAAVRPLLPHVYGTRYDFDGSRFGAFAERHGIPTGMPIPQQAFQLINDAFHVQITPTNSRRPDHGETERAQRRDALLDGARAMIALKVINRFETANSLLNDALRGLGDAIAETAEREVRSMAYQLKAARFPVYRDLAGFDFASSEVNEALVRQLHRCEFIEPADNVVLVGGPEPAS